MKNVIDKKLCTGCTACYAACPNGGIKMIADKEGLLYPAITDTCISCDKCLKVCPRINKKASASNFNKRAYAATSKNSKIWRRSSSGGAFSEICKAFGDENTIVCGAAWDGLKVHHICVEGVENIMPLCKSKYVASSLENVFIEIKNHLGNDRKVIFCGTPCQVAGLKGFLNQNHEKLLLIDLICHGVGSPAVFEVCIKAIESDFAQKIISYEFRSKNKVYDQDHIAKLEFQNGENIYITDDRYLQLFKKQHCLRSSCGVNCIYRDENRQGDITIGDFKGINEVFPELIGIKKNYSTIVINTSKGENILKTLYQTMNMMPCDLEKIKKYNPLFYSHTYFSTERTQFFADFIISPEATIKKWTVPSNVYYRSSKGKIFDLLPQIIRHRLGLHSIKGKNDEK